MRTLNARLIGSSAMLVMVRGGTQGSDAEAFENTEKESNLIGCLLKGMIVRVLYMEGTTGL